MHRPSINLYVCMYAHTHSPVSEQVAEHQERGTDVNVCQVRDPVPCIYISVKIGQRVYIDKLDIYSVRDF